MTPKEVCRLYALPPEVADILGRSGVEELYPPQEAALSSGALEGESLVLAAPTASGKTLVAELVMLQAVLGRRARALYVVPLRALAGEKYEDLRAKYTPLGIKVGLATGDYDRVDGRLADQDILVLTNEKADSLLRHRASWLLEGLGVVVLDEIHLLADPSRGPTLEVVVAALKHARPDLQLLALSATIRNVREMADWLGARAVVSDFRPVPLRAGVYLSGDILFSDGTTRGLEGSLGPVFDLVLDTVQAGGQALVFVATRRSAQSLARRLSSKVAELLTPGEREALSSLASQVEGALEEPTPQCRELARCVAGGVAFHHAGLHHRQRRAIEGAFRERALKVLCATTTLAAGVNLPARRVIIRDVRRYRGGWGAAYIPTLEYHQMAGRAGRPGLDPHGEAILIARDEAERDELLARYVLAPPERITSQLAASGAFPAHVLGALAAGYARSEGGLADFFSRTLLAHQYGTKSLVRAIAESLAFLSEEGMVRPWQGLVLPTPFGEMVAKLYIHPLSAVILRDGLRRAGGVPSELALLQLVAHTPDMETLRLSSRDQVELEAALADAEFLVPLPERRGRDFNDFLAEVKTALALVHWISETPEGKLQERFGLGPGDLFRLREEAEWLIYAAERIAYLFNFPVGPLPNLRTRLRYGVKEELLELVRLRGIGRVRARALYRAGFRSLAEVAAASPEELARVAHIGPSLARSIREQARSLREGPP
jgi:helicase